MLCIEYVVIQSSPEDIDGSKNRKVSRDDIHQDRFPHKHCQNGEGGSRQHILTKKKRYIYTHAKFTKNSSSSSSNNSSSSSSNI